MIKLSEVTLSEYDGVRYLHLGTEWVQGAMRLAAPFEIELTYVQRMMAWLLFVDPDSVPGRHAMQLGLGAGAITKFCWRQLGMRCTAVELNPRVVAACRGWFALPPDGERLRVLLADAGQEIRKRKWQASVDALAVDLYDQHAAAPVLDSAEFYADCRGVLSADGCLTVNLFGRAASFDQSLRSIVAAFGARAVWTFRPTREGNTVVLAQRSVRKPTRAQMRDRLTTLRDRWGLPTHGWPRVFGALEK